MRRHLAAVGLVALVALAGCSAVGGGDGIDREALAANATYDWDTSADVTIDVGAEEYRAVYRIENATSVEVYGFQRFNNKRPLDISAVQFRYPDGRVVDASGLDVEQTRSRTVIGLPAREGQLAYTAEKSGKRIRVPTPLSEASYEVILPPGARVRYPLLGRVIPRGYDRTMEGGRAHLRWERGEVSGDRLVVQYYLARDLLVFGGIVALSAAVLLGGVVYFWFQLRELRRRREDVGLDVDTDEDSGRF